MAGERLNSMYIDLRARTLKLERDLKTANGKIARSGKKLGGSLGAGMGKAFSSTFVKFLGAAVITAQIKKSIDLGSQISDLATGARVGAEDFQILSFAMREAGGEMTNMANALAKLQKNVADAGSGLSTAKRGLANLNLSFQEMRGLDPAQMFIKLAEGLDQSGDGLKSYGAAMDLLGAKNAPRLMEVLQRLGEDGFEQLSADARKAGSIMSDQVVADMDTLADHIGNFMHSISVRAGGGVSELMRPMEAWLKTQLVFARKLRGMAIDHDSIKSFMILDEQVKKLEADLNKLVEARQEVGAAPPLFTPEQLAQMEAHTARLEVLDQVANRLKESLKTPFDIAAEKMKDYTDALEAGFITTKEKIAGDSAAITEAADKMKEEAGPVAEAWERTSERMATSLSEAFIEGGDALDDYLARALRAMAAAAIESQIFAPLLGMLGVDKDLGGIFKKFGGFLGFAHGGRPPVGVPSVVGERGPEIFVPRSAGTIIPNHATSGFGSGNTSNVVINQTINFNTDLAEVRNQISQAAPLIASATQTQLRDSQLRGQT